jgi:hypothetical protein
MVSTIVKSALLGLTLGAALAYAAEPDPTCGAEYYTRDGGTPPSQDAPDKGVGAAGPSEPTPPKTVVLPPLLLASLRPDAGMATPPTAAPRGKTMR